MNPTTFFLPGLRFRYYDVIFARFLIKLILNLDRKIDVL